jgi:hypothetical protein
VRGGGRERDREKERERERERVRLRWACELFNEVSSGFQIKITIPIFLKQEIKLKTGSFRGIRRL